MARTYRRKSGNQWFAVSCRDEVYNNPYYFRSRYSVSGKPGFKEERYIHKYDCSGKGEHIYRTYKVPTTIFTRTWVDNPRPHIEMLEMKLKDIKNEKRWRRDFYSSSPANKCLKLYTKRGRRTHERLELHRISKELDYNDMHFVDRIDDEVCDIWHYD